MPTGNVARALKALREGGVVVVTDDTDREDEADLIMAAECATPESVAFFLQHTSGYLCVSVTSDRATELALPPMVAANTERHTTAFLVTVDLHTGISTGISAHDRARTARALADPYITAADLDRPGHVLPLLARDGGVLERPGHTEAGVDLCRLAGRRPAALLCEIVTADRLGMLRGPAVQRFAAEQGLPLVSIRDLIDYRRASATAVVRTGEAEIPTPFGTFHAIAYRSSETGIEHLALVLGRVDDDEPVLVRVHSECLTGDLIGSLRCDCGPQLHAALESVAAAGRGVIVYHRGHEGRGIGIGSKLRAYELQQRLGLDTVDANVHLGLKVDSRQYGVAAGVLADLGVTDIRLMTNNPDKLEHLSRHGLTITERVSIESSPTPDNLRYLTTKRDRMGHLLDLPALDGAPTPQVSLLAGGA